MSETERIIKDLVEKNDRLRDSYKKIENLIFSHGPEGRNYTNQQYVDLLQKLESLKAITELAVKRLKEIACLNVDSAYSAGTIARNTFSEIEKLNPIKEGEK